MVEALNRYKLSIDLDLIFDSKNDFLYRQKGQLKLDNTVLEEFMPWLVRRVLAGRLAERELTIGPANAFLITTQTKRNLSSRSGIGGVLSAT